ncbi:hypothetical protein NPIL_477641 [Nephila pilipes]|uniref:Uncharacterized protein n=1 Tax=Nephila pilipes TaxID=299642 RepID=A0A8X6PTV8_NEPPI|nr:hypothetical protein NPIL_477641 [Nephila pilipes]
MTFDCWSQTSHLSKRAFQKVTMSFARDTPFSEMTVLPSDDHSIRHAFNFGEKRATPPGGSKERVDRTNSSSQPLTS